MDIVTELKDFLLSQTKTFAELDFIIQGYCAQRVVNQLDFTETMTLPILEKEIPDAVFGKTKQGTYWICIGKDRYEVNRWTEKELNKGGWEEVKKYTKK